MKEIGYDEIARNQVHKSRYTVTPEVANTYAELVGTQEPDELAGPWVFCSFFPWYRALGGRPKQGSIHLRQDMELFGPTYVGEDLQVELRILGKRIRKGRRYVNLETRYKSGQDLRCRSNATLLWGYAQQ